MRWWLALAGAAAFAAGWRRAGRRPARVLRVSRVVGDLGRAEAFYCGVLGFERVGGGVVDPAVVALLGVPGCRMEEVVLRLGGEEVALVQAWPAGAAYPEGSRGDDLWFQHLAIVVGDMGAASARVAAAGVEPISTGGPQRLPKRNGRVVAFKFRDPDGHPLELIHFPPGVGRTVWQRGGDGVFLGIDHSAMAVGETGRSVRFYRRLGFRVASRSLNYGGAQAALDGIAGARAVVTGLRGGDEGMGLELLGYEPPGRGMEWRANDRVMDWVTVEAGGRRRVRRDPDGHAVLVVG